MIVPDYIGTPPTFRALIEGHYVPVFKRSINLGLEVDIKAVFDELIAIRLSAA